MTKKRRNFDLEMMQNHALEKGGRCLSGTYINSTFKLLFICQQGHKWRATPLEIMGKKSQSPKWCPKCELKT